jgi:hypothetical protein
VAPRLAGIPLSDAPPVRKGFGNYFSAADLAKVAEFHPDVLLRFGFGILRGPILVSRLLETDLQQVT